MAVTAKEREQRRQAGIKSAEARRRKAMAQGSGAADDLAKAKVELLRQKIRLQAEKEARSQGQHVPLVVVAQWMREHAALIRREMDRAPGVVDQMEIAAELRPLCRVIAKQIATRIGAIVARHTATAPGMTP